MCLEKHAQLVKELTQQDIWSDVKRAKEVSREKTRIEKKIDQVDAFESHLVDCQAMLLIAEQDEDESAFNLAVDESNAAEKKIAVQEFNQMFSGEMDHHNAYLEVTSGSGGTEAQDWAEMLLRMYLRWCEAKGFDAKLTELSGGDVAGIKSATVSVCGDDAYGWLRTETGVHRLVRRSPFDSGHRRHTSFAAIFVSPQIEEDIQIEINPADVRVDVYRASGAGGQHVNKTDSAVRLTHLPTNIVTQCQSDRSQHKNRDMAMKQLRAKLYRYELDKRDKERLAVEESKADIGWGSQIRSYVLDQSRIKDLRTNFEMSDTRSVLDGNLDAFIEASLKHGVK